MGGKRAICCFTLYLRSMDKNKYHNVNILWFILWIWTFYIINISTSVYHILLSLLSTHSDNLSNVLLLINLTSVILVKNCLIGLVTCLLARFFSLRVVWFLIRYKRSTARFSNVADNSSQSSSVTLPQGRISFIISFFILFDCSMGWQDLISMRFTQDLISMRSWRATQAPAMNRGAWEFNLMSVHIY